MKQINIIRKLGACLAILTLAVLSCSGASDIPSLFATETPTPTLTFTPSPTATETLTPTPLPSGTVTVVQADGSTLLMDYDNRFQLVLPEGWIVIPLSSKDLSTVLQNLSEKNPEFTDVAETFKNLDPNVIRAMVVNADPKYMANGFSTNITITAIEDKIMSSMPLDFVTGAVEESLEQQGAKLISDFEPAARNSNGVEIGTFGYKNKAPTVTGANVQVLSTTILFQTNSKLIMVQLATLQQFGEELLPVLDQVADSIKLLEP